MKINKTKQMILKKILYIVATPIGNLNDISIRALETLQDVNYIICENPKHSLKLLNNKGIKKKLLPLHDYNEEIIIKKISQLKNIQKIALISDAGSPLISDPGYKLVKYFIDNELEITVVPGASSIISSLQLSGLPINNFAFYGFIPKQESKQKQLFDKIKENNLTSIILVSAKNLKSAIKKIIEFLGERDLSLCKEITKINEQVFRGSAKEILKLINNQKILLKGEFTLVVSGKFEKSSKKINDNIRKELVKLLKKYNLTEAVKIVHSLSGISRRDLYKMAIKIKND